METVRINKASQGGILRKITAHALESSNYYVTLAWPGEYDDEWPSFVHGTAVHFVAKITSLTGMRQCLCI
jgi:hypothetical protein